MGIYVFGGEKENKHPTNELFYIRAKEKKPLSSMKFSTPISLIQIAEQTVECFKPSISGKPPIPRSRHCAHYIPNKYLVIYAGYNSEHEGSGIINDVIMLNLCINMQLFNCRPISMGATRIVRISPRGKILVHSRQQ